MNMTNAECKKYISAEAKSCGLTFRAQKNLKINGVNAYCFTVRGGGNVVMKNCTLGSALKIAESGYLQTFDLKTESFI